MIDSVTYGVIAQLQQTYADIASRGAWGEASALFTPDTKITFHTWSGAVFEARKAWASGNDSRKVATRERAEAASIS